ncbi:MAG: aminodeoxychorismate synthase, component I [Candidatus Dadabacteria bacterium]
MNIKYPFSALLLDSNGGWTSDKENSFILFGNPVFSLSFKGSAGINPHNRGLSSIRDPLSILEGYVSEGYFAIGYMGYEFSRFTQEEFLPVREKEGELFPDIFFLFFREEDMTLGKIENLKYLIQIPSQDNLRGLVSPYANMSKDEYIDMVRRAKAYIESGDIYQVNLSQRFTTSIRSSPIAYFLSLYDVQPVPFGCYIDFGGFQLISSSMELFLRRRGGKLVTKPIKGTRRRGLTSEADAILKAELVSSEKERAENLMIVDLMRNDLGRVCKYGTVRVNRLFSVESYSTLHHMVSEIEGQLRDGIKTSDIIKSAFPPGSVTGTPKRRALEIIDELEPHLRGPYCGAIGVFYPNGDFILSVAIRVLISKGCKTMFWVGGGIVWDSAPEKEYEETLIKARAINKALGMTE